MSEENNNNVEPEVIETAEVADDPLLAIPEEDRKYAKGWKADDPKGRSLEDFVAFGKLISQSQAAKAENKRLQEEFRQQSEATKLLHQAHMKSLKQQLAEATQMSDINAVERISEEISQAKIVTQQASMAPDLSYAQEWQSKPENAWIFDEDDPKALYAKNIFDKALNNGKSAIQAIEEMEYKVSLKFNPEKPQKAPTTVSSQTRSGAANISGKELTMKDCTADERKLYKEMPYAWADEKAFLKAVKESRGE